MLYVHFSSIKLESKKNTCVPQYMSHMWATCVSVNVLVATIKGKKEEVKLILLVHIFNQIPLKY